MPASFFDHLKGTFKNGIPPHLVPEPHSTVFSLQDNIHNLINVRQGSDFLRPLYGIPHIPDILFEIPPNIRNVQVQLKSMLLMYEPRIIKLAICGWSISRKGLFSQCLLICEHKRGKCAYVLQFKGEGNNVVTPWKRDG